MGGVQSLTIKWVQGMGGVQSLTKNGARNGRSANPDDKMVQTMSGILVELVFIPNLLS